jgi:O-Antigen ligase
MAKGLSREFGAPNVGPLSTMRPLYWLLVLLSLVPLCVVLPMAPLKVGIGAIAGWIVMLWVAIAFVRGQFHYVVPLWVAFYPYCYYFFTFPKERSVFTVDRAFVLLLIIEMLLVSRQNLAPAPLTRDVRVSAYFWGLFLLACFLSLASHAPSHELAFYRLLIEGMVMPALLGLYVMRYFPLLKDIHKLHLSACILGIGLCVTGLIELTTNIDLFPWEGSEPMFTDTHLRRADGPFEQQVVLSIVAILAFFFIIYLRRLMPDSISTWRTILHRIGCVTSLGAALLPLNRGLVFALVPIALIDSFSKHRLISRRIWATFFGLILLAAIAAKVLDPRLYEDRVSSPDNAYQRVAQHIETLHVVREYPLFGVGFGLYHDVASRNPRYMVKWKGIESMNFPHNVLMTVLSEEGIVGLLFYVLSQVFLVRAMWKLRGAFPAGWLAFLYCFLIYVLTGLDFAIVCFADINLFYMLIVGAIYQHQVLVAGKQELPIETALPQTVYA